jgi:hypothetical protein
MVVAVCGSGAGAVAVGMTTEAAVCAIGGVDGATIVGGVAAPDVVVAVATDGKVAGEDATGAGTAG